MVRLIVFIFVGASVLAAVPHYVMRYQDAADARADAAAQRHAVLAENRPWAARGASSEAASPAASVSSGQVMRLTADRSGHFVGDFRLNGRAVEGLVDTGATYIAINASTARRLGVSPARSDFVHEVRTANGRTQAARVVLDTVDIGPIRVRGVEALVLEDASLSMTLVGMSFMTRLRSYGVENGQLLLVN